jgi:hypothetical protein
MSTIPVDEAEVPFIDDAEEFILSL